MKSFRLSSVVQQAHKTWDAESFRSLQNIFSSHCFLVLVNVCVLWDEDDDDGDAFTIIFAKAALLFLDNQADEHQQWSWRQHAIHTILRTKWTRRGYRKMPKDVTSRWWWCTEMGSGKRQTACEWKQLGDSDKDANAVHTVCWESVFRLHTRAMSDAHMHYEFNSFRRRVRKLPPRSNHI